MNAYIRLTNGKRTDTDSIKCPICGERMVYDKGRSEVPDRELFIRDESQPVVCRKLMSEETYRSHFVCPAGCVEFDIEHWVEKLIAFI